MLTAIAVVLQIFRCKDYKISWIKTWKSDVADLVLIIVALGAVEGPVTSSDARIIYNGDGAVKYVESKALNPLVPVTLIELVACVWVTEQTCSLTNLWA